MADIKILPKDWKEKSKELSFVEAEEFKILEPGVWINDKCPISLSVIVKDEGKTYEIRRASTSLLRMLGAPEELIKIYIHQNIPNVETILPTPSDYN